MMFQTRTFTFPLKNTSSARMDYKFYITTADGSKPDTSGLYTVSPEGGIIEAGSTADITIKFAPVEVEDCLRLLVCDIPNLDTAVEPLAMQLGGKVLRPWCHFDLPDSDYISGKELTNAPYHKGRFRLH
jgi:hydrocephalus-inducing protein